MRIIRILTAALTVASAARASGPRIDLNQDVPRGDVISSGWENWRVPERPTASTKVGAISIALRAANLGTSWWKPGFDYPARMASDGVVVAGPLELVLSGLTPGRHSLATYHNGLTGAKPNRITVSVRQGMSTTVTPSRHVQHDADAAAAYVEFDAIDGQEVVITLVPDESGSVVLNGFELDRSDPGRRAMKPEPADGDEHAVEAPALSWRPGAGATAHRIYLGTSPEDLALRAEVSGANRSVNTAGWNLNHQQRYFWRVDEVSAEGVVTGEVWSFRVRHLAFPEAEGYGRFAIGGRGGKVYEVTNLNDSGPGSLREAVEASGPRMVVFRVGGVIALKSKLVVRNPYLTVAGQTAPGDGICVTNFTFGCSDTHDVIVRHVRIRIGDASGVTQDGCGARGSDHVIFDHCSISWSIDEGFSSREGRNLTVQRCIIAEALHLAGHAKYLGTGKGHSFAGSISGNVGSFHHNLLAHCTGRNWSLAGGLDRTGARLAGRLDLRNNVVYNWRDRTTDGGVRELNFVNNYYLPGPATTVFTLLKPDPGDPERGMRAYMDGNVIVGRADFDDNWRAYVGPSAGMAKVRSVQPLFDSFVTTHTAPEALESVLADVGATKPKQDVLDSRILSEVRARKHTYTGSRGRLPGIIDSPHDVGGLPAYQTIVSPSDQLPDNTTYRDDGYTHLEHYLNIMANP